MTGFVGVTCVIVNQTYARLTFSGVSGTVSAFEGKLGLFRNPDSVRTLSGVQLNLISGTTLLVKATQTSSISSFLPKSFTVSLASSSKIVAASGATLTVSLLPDTVLKASGSLMLQVPNYFTNSGTQQMFISSQVSCLASLQTTTGASSSIQVGISSCAFSPATLQVSIVYSLVPLSDVTSLVMVLTIHGFRNPISTKAKEGFILASYDSMGFLISSRSSISLSGITTPAGLNPAAISILDDQVVQEYGSVQIKLSFDIPIEKGCYARFIFPADFTIDEKLTTLSGTGIFTTSAGFFTDLLTTYSTRTVQFRACDVQYGSTSNVGVISFSKVKNPLQVKLTDSFNVTFARDIDFTDLVIQTATGLTVQASQFQSGSISGITAAFVESSLVQTDTSYKLSFTPSSSLLADTSSQIVITFPSTITLTQSNSCLVTIPDGSSILSPSTINCAFTSKTQATIYRPFSSTYSGGTSITLTVGNATNPISEQYTGAFTIKTFIIKSGTQYLVDTGTSSDTILYSTIGRITKAADIAITQSVTYYKDATYLFKLTFDHAVPTGGYLIFTLPIGSDVVISDASKVQNTCLQVDSSKALTCASINANTAIKVAVDKAGWVGSSIPTGATRSIQFTGLRNPRTLFPSASFIVTSYDSSGNRIDANTQLDLPVGVAGSANYSSFSVSAGNQTNGAVTKYQFVFVSPTPTTSSDWLYIKLPSELAITNSAIASCVPSLPTALTSAMLDCSNQGTQTMLIKFSKMAFNITENTQIVITLGSITNAKSTKPSSPFSEVYMTNFRNGLFYEVVRYRANALKITNTIPGTFNTISLLQSNTNSEAAAYYTITFKPLNPIPKTGAILIRASTNIKFITDNTQCTIFVGQLLQNICKVGRSVINIETAFSNQGGDYIDTVRITFQAYNPTTSINPMSMGLETYVDNTYQYMIDKADSGIVPTLGCTYPCKTCPVNSPNFCTSCFQGSLMPELVQINSTNSSQQTCVQDCSDGYTPNGTKDPRICTKCDSTCLTCVQDDVKGDVSKCLSCVSQYPFLYAANRTCNSKCPDTTYLSNRFTCSACVFPCKTCSSESSCISCNTTSSKPLLWNDKCLDTCPYGFTKVGFQCQQCTSPCATCSVGSTTQCLTCDASKGRQYLYGRDCVSACPLGTIPDVKVSNTNQSICKGCIQGCDLCDEQNNAFCLKCTTGLSILNGTCYSDCPFNYVKSKDGGSSCEIRGYLLDDSLVYFPFCCFALVMIFLCLTSYLVTGKRSLIISNAIGLLGFVEYCAILFQMYESYTSQRQYIIITAATLVIFILYILMNLAFLGYYCCRMQYADPAFNFWKKKNGWTVAILLTLSGVVSFKLFRLLYSRLFAAKIFSAQIDDPVPFTRRVQLFGLISIVIVTLPLCIVDVLIIYYLEWGSQLYITCGESGAISLLIAIMTLTDNCCACSRLTRYVESEHDDIPAALLGKSGSKKVIFDIPANGGNDDTHNESARPFLGIHENPEEKRERRQREQLLRGLISAVHFHKSLQFDADEEESDEDDPDKPERRRVKSFTDLREHLPVELRGEDPRETKSLQSGSEIKKRVKIERLKNLAEQNYLNLLEIPPSEMGGSQGHHTVSHHTTGRHRNTSRATSAKHSHLEKESQTFHFNNVIAESRVPVPVREVVYIDASGAAFTKPVVTELEIQTDDIDEYGLLKVDRTTRKVDDVIPEDSSELSLEQEFKESDVQELTRLQRRGKGKKRGQTTKSFYFTQADAESAPNQSDNLSAIDEVQHYKSQDKRKALGSDQLSKSSKEKKSLKSIQKLDKDIDELVASSSTHKLKSSSKDRHNSSNTTSTKLKGQHIATKKRSEPLHEENASIIKTTKQRANTAQKRSRLHQGHSFEGRRLESVLSQSRSASKTSPNKSASGSRSQSKTASKKSTLKSKRSRRQSRKSTGQNEDLSSEEDPTEKLRIQQRIAMMPDRELFHQRSFNILDIMGDFIDDVDVEGLVREFDSFERPVNKKGYVVAREHGGAIINKYNYNIMFTPDQLNNCDIPNPFKLECFNFNPHDIMGDFDLDSQTFKPIILKSKKTGRLVDKNLKLVNQFGYLVDEGGNIVNHESKIRLKREQLRSNGDFPFLLNYDGKAFDMKTIIGTFDRDHQSKQIILRSHPVYGYIVDRNGRRTNPAGYLVDDQMNIVYKGGEKVVFYASQLLFNEPPKIFEFSKFDIMQIISEVPRQMKAKKSRQRIKDEKVTISEEDSDGVPKMKSNCKGYLVDDEGNIIDRKGNLVFRKEILEPALDEATGKLVPAEIPYVFRDKNVEIARKSAQALKQAQKKSLLMLDSEQFIKDQLENLQNRIQRRDIMKIEEDNESVQSSGNHIIVETNVRDPGENELLKSLNESELQKEIMMFNQEQTLGQTVLIQGQSLLNQRPEQVNLSKQILSKIRKQQPNQAKKLKIEANRSQSHLSLKDQRRQMPTYQSMQRTTSALLGSQNGVIQAHQPIRNRFMQSSHQSGDSHERTSALNISGLRIMQNDESTSQINLEQLAHDDDEFDDGDTVFEKDFDTTGHLVSKAKRALRSKSQQRLAKLTMYDTSSMRDLQLHQRIMQQQQIRGLPRETTPPLPQARLAESHSNPRLQHRVRELNNIYEGSWGNNQNGKKRSKGSIPKNLQGYSGVASNLDEEEDAFNQTSEFGRFRH